MPEDTGAQKVGLDRPLRQRQSEGHEQTRPGYPQNVASPQPVADIGHVHLKVADLDRALRFYRDVIGMDVRNTMQGAVFLAFGNYHHHLALNVWESEHGKPPDSGATGLYHFAIRFSSRAGLAAVLKRLLDSDIVIESSSDAGGVVESIYVRDPDNNGVELTWDRPRELWPAPEDREERPLDFQQLLGLLQQSQANVTP